MTNAGNQRETDHWKSARGDIAHARKAFDENTHGRAMIEGDARAFDLTKTGAGAGYFGHEGGFAEAHLANALAEIVAAAQFAYPAGRSGGELAEGGEEAERRIHWTETQCQQKSPKAQKEIPVNPNCWRRTA